MPNGKWFCTIQKESWWNNSGVSGTILHCEYAGMISFGGFSYQSLSERGSKNGTLASGWFN